MRSASPGSRSACSSGRRSTGDRLASGTKPSRLRHTIRDSGGSAPSRMSASIVGWPRSRRASISSWRRSGPSSPGSVITFDPVALKARLDEFEAAMGAPGFWDDQAEAARISTEQARVSRKLERYERLRRDYADARELYELDPSLAGEVEAQLVPLHEELDRLQEDALFTGEYDSGAAVLSVNRSEE